MPSTLLPLTLTQHDIYLDQLRHPDKPLYNVGGYINVCDITPARLQAAHARLVSENELFGLRIVRHRDGVFQTLGDVPTTTLVDVDLSGTDDPIAQADAWIKTLFETALAMENAELFRAYLLILGNGRYRYVGMAHHICMDGWGFSNWAGLLCDLYNDPKASAVPELPWRDIALDDVRYMESKQYAGDKAYWSAHLADMPVPLFAARTGTDSTESCGRRCTIELSREELDAWKSLALELRAGISHLLLALLAVYFFHCHGQRRHVFGLPFHNRRSHAQKQMLGVFAGISPLCIELNDSDTFSELVRTISKRQLSSLRHQRYPLGHMLRDMAGMSGRRALYEVGFNYLQLGGELAFDETEADLAYVSNNHGNTPLMLNFCEYGKHGAVQLQLDYQQAFISDDDILLMRERLTFLLRSLRHIKDQRIINIAIMPDGETQRLLQGYGDHPVRNPSNACIHQLFEMQAKQTPDAVAVLAGEITYTYRQLNAKANQVAHRLLLAGAKPESLVGIYMERTADLIVALLGVLKAGAAYVPLDCTYPWQRVQMLVEDSGLQWVLTQRQFSGVLEPLDAPLLYVEECTQHPGRADDELAASQIGVTAASLAYVIYTSGSTGKPKGVEICHGNTVALLDWVRTVYAPDDLSAVMASTSINFDLSIFEMFAPLTCGGCCVLVRDGLAILSQRVAVTLINTVPSAMKMLLEQDAVPAGVRVVNLAGEPLPMTLVNELLLRGKCGRVINLYGPSEDTTYSTYAIFETPIARPPAIGRAIAGTKLYVLSPEAKLVPMGAVGELHVAGKGLARGYLNAPELTAEKFICNPFDDGVYARLYKTGDVVRYRADGELEYLGRLDGQVKIRGFRIELGEIQRNLEQLEGVKTAVVLVKGDGSLGKHLMAFVERWRRPPEGGVDISDESWAEGLRRSLCSVLPGYMVPAMIFVLAQMPLTSNGKVDKKALEAMEGQRSSKPVQVAPPKTPVEMKLTGLWADLLGVDSTLVGMETSLFDLGGHSLLLVRLTNQIQHEFGIDFPITTCFQAENLGDLAEKVETEITIMLVEQKMSCADIVSEGYL